MKYAVAFRILVVAAAALSLLACSVWPVNQDPDGIAYRQDANRVLFALQAYRARAGQFPSRLDALVPQYLPKLPDVPNLHYYPASGALEYRYVPTWPQLRWTWCQSVGDSTNWKCQEHLI